MEPAEKNRATELSLWCLKIFFSKDSLIKMCLKIFSNLEALTVLKQLAIKRKSFDLTFLPSYLILFHIKENIRGKNP